MIELNFNPADHESMDFDVLPAGKYRAIIADVEKKTTKKGDGAYLSLKIEIVGGEYQGRIVWDNLNIWNQNQKAVQIAQGTLASICDSLGIIELQNAEELIGKPLGVVLGIEQYNGNEKNTVKKYASLGTGAAPVEQKPAPTAEPIEDEPPF